MKSIVKLLNVTTAVQIPKINSEKLTLNYLLQKKMNPKYEIIFPIFYKLFLPNPVPEEFVFQLLRFNRWSARRNTDPVRKNIVLTFFTDSIVSSFPDKCVA